MFLLMSHKVFLGFSKLIWKKFKNKGKVFINHNSKKTFAIFQILTPLGNLKMKNKNSYNTMWR